MKLKSPHPVSMTSVNIFTDKYATYKGMSVHTGITLQKLINRTLHLYLTDETFREKINTCNDLQISGSSF